MTHPWDRGPRVYDKIVVYGERMTVLRLIERGDVPMIVTHDDADQRIEVRVDAIEWNETLAAWTKIADRRDVPVVPVSYLRCAECGHKLDAWGGCDSCAADLDGIA